MRSIAKTALFCMPLLAACDPADVEPLADAPEDLDRGNTGKAEAPGSCQPADCGDRASIGSCWCDDQCVQYNDCCADKVAVCDGGDAPEPTGAGPVGGDPDWAFADVWGVPNLDDDDGVHTDWQQYVFAGDDDVAVIELGDALSTMQAGERVQLVLSGDTDQIRVWHDGEPAVGAAAASNTYTFDPQAGDVLQVEFGYYRAEGTLSIRRVSGSTVVAQDQVALRAAPLVINHHLQPSEHVWAVEVDSPGYDNDALIETYEAVLGSAFTAVHGPSYGNDVWMQDEFEFGTLLGGQGERLDVVIDSIRDRGLDRYAEDALVGPGFIAGTWGQAFMRSTFDSFGNLEATPPVSVGGVDYPLGRIYYGRTGSEGPVLGLRNFLADQSVQAPFEIPTSWLCVGHVDEVSSFIPDPSAPRGFRLLLADADAGYDLVDSLPSSRTLGRYGADHGYATVGAIKNDAALRALNADIQDDYLDPIRAIFTQQLGLSASEIIEVPSVFEHLGGCGAAALVPGMVNLIVADGQDGDTHLFVPDPFFRSAGAGQHTDAFIDAFADRMPSSLRLHFVDNWDVYHLGIGEVHCGTNVTRTPTDAWWNATDLVD